MILTPPCSTLFPYTTLFRSLDVENNVGDVFDDARNRRDFVHHALNLDAGDGATFERRKQHPPQAVADSHAEAALEGFGRSEEHTSELQSLTNLVCRLLLEKK